MSTGPNDPINGSEFSVQLLIYDSRSNHVGQRIGKRDASACGSIILLVHIHWIDSSHGYFFGTYQTSETPVKYISS